MPCDSRQSDSEHKKCWAGELAQFLRNLGYRSRPDGPALIDEDGALDALRAKYDDVWQGLPRYPRQAADRVRFATYFAWFDGGQWLRRPPYLFFDLSARATCTYMRFRLGTHNLQVNLGRWERPRPRCQRMCERCAMHVVDDERHLVFECSAFEGLRLARRHLFSAAVGENMKAFMAQGDQRGVVCFVLSCLRALDQPRAQGWPDVDLHVDVAFDTCDD